jgi:hypothetical protein
MGYRKWHRVPSQQCRMPSHLSLHSLNLKYIFSPRQMGRNNGCTSGFARLGMCSGIYSIADIKITPP